MFPMHTQDTDRRHPALRYEAAQRSGSCRVLPIKAVTVARRCELTLNQWRTSFSKSAILPLQFFTEPGRTGEFASGAQRLMFAVLQDAVACWFRWRDGDTIRKRRLFQETHDWFWAQNSSGLYTFENICDVLKLNPGYIRRGLMRWHPSVQEQHTQPGSRPPSVVTRRPAIPHAPVLAAPRLAPRRRGK